MAARRSPSERASRDHGPRSPGAPRPTCARASRWTFTELFTRRVAPAVAGAIFGAASTMSTPAIGAPILDVDVDVARSATLAGPSVRDAHATPEPFVFEGPFTERERERLEGVIDRLTPAERARIEGVVLTRGGRDPELSGRYEGRYSKGRVVLFDGAFAAPRLARTIARPDRDWVLFHELGHAVMYGADRLAALRADQLLASYGARLDQFLAAPRGPARVEAQGALFEARRAHDEANQRVDYGSDRRRFEQVARGHPAVTAYGATELDEGFAEAFAMFKTQPDALAAFDAELFAYFARGDHVVDWEERPDGTFVPRSPPATR